MQPHSQLIPVKFQSDLLYLTEQKKDPYVPMKPVVEGMGLDRGTQFRKLTAEDSRWKSTIVMMTTVGNDNKAREMICLRLKKLPGWLMSISPSKVDPAMRERVISYQNECDDVLWQHWSGVRKGDSNTKLNTLNDMNRELVAAANMAKVLGFSSNFARVKAVEVVKQQHGVDTAAMFGLTLEDMCPQDRMAAEIKRLNMPSQDILLQPFWDLFTTFEAEQKHIVNWSKDPQKIAINLAAFKRLCIERGVPVPEALTNKKLLKESYNPKFVAANVSHRHVLDSSQSRCWIFSLN